MKTTAVIVAFLVLVTALVSGQGEEREAKCTAYCWKCPDGGYSRPVAFKFKRETCAADLRYHPKGTVIWFGPPINGEYVVNNTGGAIKGRDRFDICLGKPDRCRCNSWGVKHIHYRVIKGH